MDNNNTIEAQSAAPADAAQPLISASAAGASSASPANDIPKLDPAKLAKTLEVVERLEKRAELAPAKETTGSVPPPPAAAAAPVQPPQPSVVPGWTVRDVYRGMAIIQGARTGPIEVEAGDTVPFLGRIEAIRRQDGHWVVVTSKGIIAAAR